MLPAHLVQMELLAFLEKVEYKALQALLEIPDLQDKQVLPGKPAAQVRSHIFLKKLCSELH